MSIELKEQYFTKEGTQNEVGQIIQAMDNEGEKVKGEAKKDSIGKLKAKQRFSKRKTLKAFIGAGRKVATHKVTIYSLITLLIQLSMVLLYKKLTQALEC